MKPSQLGVEIFIYIGITKVCNNFSLHLNTSAFKSVLPEALYRAAFVLTIVYLEFAFLDCILILVTENASF